MSHTRSLNSTNGRSLGHVGARILVKTLEMVAPRRASAFLAGAFLRPPRFPAPASEAALLEGAVSFRLPVGGELLHGFRLGEGPAVLLVHGWGGRGGQLSTLAAPLLAAGCAVIGFDGPAHGRSTGRSASVVQFAEAVAAFARAVEARAAIGHSMGAAALALAISHGVKLDAAVLVSPPRTPAPFFDGFSAALGVEYYTRERARGLIERRLGARMADLDVERVAANAGTPVLVVHDRDDQEVPCAEGVAIARAWPGSRLIVTRGLGHRRILKDPDVAGAAAAFVIDGLPRCACGRLASATTASDAQCETCALEAYLEAREERAAPTAA
jgi:pimeloyl-ACP methyl ester carboxylesterase